MANCLIRSLMKREGLTEEQAIELVQEEVESFDGDIEEALYSLGYEPDYCFDVYNVLEAA